MPVALITGGSAGLGLALVRALAARSWTVVTDGRDHERLAAATDHLDGVVAVPGDVTDAGHRGALVAAVERAGALDLLVHNASTLGSPRDGRTLRPLDQATVEDLQHVWRTNVGAPLALTTAALPQLRRSRGTLVGISSDAAAEHYETWGLYGAAKAALDHLVLTFGAEHPEIATYAVDPGDLRTALHQEAFPGEDISDRPLPEEVVPDILTLLERRPASGRYRAADLGATADGTERGVA